MRFRARGEQKKASDEKKAENLEMPWKRRRNRKLGGKMLDAMKKNPVPNAEDKEC